MTESELSDWLVAYERTFEGEPLTDDRLAYARMQAKHLDDQSPPLSNVLRADRIVADWARNLVRRRTANGHAVH